MIESYHINDRVRMLRENAAVRWSIDEKDCHVGHLILQGMLQEPDVINQIDGVTGKQETNLSVAKRTAQLASAMAKYGLKPGDTVVVMGTNHLDLTIPFYACHIGGYSMCAIDPMGSGDLKKLWTYIHPKMIFCQKACEENIKQAFRLNRQSCKMIVFDDENANITTFVKQYGGTAINYRPAIIDQGNIAAWLILTSGTTGTPKVSIIPYSTVLNAIICWWLPITEKIESVFAMATIQWMSGLLFFVSGPIKACTRVQSEATVTGPILVGIINKYKPQTTAWTPYLLGRFLEAAEKVCDLTCFKYILIGGGTIEKHILDKLKKLSNAHINFVYGMTELLVPVFDYNSDITPSGSSGKPFLDKYEYKLIDNDDHTIEKPHVIGELLIKGDAFFKGYMNNPEETKHMLTDDGWFKTGDLFYKDNDNNYYFVERQRLLIKHYGFQISPLQMEEVLKRHRSVAEACVVNVQQSEYMELPVAAILRKNGDKVDFQDLFDLLNNNIAEGRKLSTGFFFVDAIPTTASGKVHRAKIREMAVNAEWTVFHRNV